MPSPASRRDYFLPADPQVGLTPRQERAMEVAARVNAMYRTQAGSPHRCRMTDVLSRWDDRAYAGSVQ